MHANAFLPRGRRGFALVFNPTLYNVTQSVTFPLYYTGIATTAAFSREGAAPVAYALARDYTVTFAIALPPQSVTWYAIASED